MNHYDRKKKVSLKPGDVQAFKVQPTPFLMALILLTSLLGGVVGALLVNHFNL